MRSDDSLSTITRRDAPNLVAPATAAGPFRVWARDEAHFSTKTVCPLQHNFDQHPLMQLDRLEQLAKSLFAAGQCRFIKPGTTQASKLDFAGKAPDGRDLDEVFRRLEEPGSWIALYHVETDPAYQQMVKDAVESMRHLIDREQPGLFLVQGFIFISAPPSVTPFHIDRENNFWLQIRGKKIMNVWEAGDRDVVAARDVENFIVDESLDGVKLHEELRARSHEYEYGRGEGVYFPSTSPHATRCDTAWAKPGDGISVSIGIVFYTDTTRQHAYVHALNKVMRRLGANPRFPGTSPLIDRIKYPFGRALVGLRRRLRGYKLPTGF